MLSHFDCARRWTSKLPPTKCRIFFLSSSTVLKTCLLAHSGRTFCFIVFEKNDGNHMQEHQPTLWLMHILLIACEKHSQFRYNLDWSIEKTVLSVGCLTVFFQSIITIHAAAVVVAVAKKFVPPNWRRQREEKLSTWHTVVNHSAYK